MHSVGEYDDKHSIHSIYGKNNHPDTGHTRRYQDINSENKVVQDSPIQGKQVKSILLKKRKQINILDEISKFKVPRTETRNATTDKIMSRLENSQYRRDLCAVSSVENVSRSPYQCYEFENVQYMGKHQMISWKFTNTIRSTPTKSIHTEYSTCVYWVFIAM